MDTALSTSQIVAQACLFAFAAIGIFGGSLQMYLGQPDTTARLDNLHRFLAGVYLSMSKVGLPAPRALWLGYLASELVLPCVLAVAHFDRAPS